MNTMIVEFAKKVNELGFTAYLAKSLNYGFYTDEAENRLVCFGSSYGYIKLRGNYFSERNGTGWIINNEFTLEQANKKLLNDILYLNSPFEFLKYTSVSEHLLKYNSSNYMKFQ